MAEAEPETTDQTIANAITEDNESKASSGGGMFFPIVAAVIIVIAAVGGYFAARLGAASPQTAEAADAPIQEESPDTVAGENGEQYVYHDLEAITVNLNEPRLARHVRAEFTVACLQKDSSAIATILEERAPELKNWLILYLSDCSLEDVRGKKNLSRVLREVQDTFNERLWPQGRPLIAKVDLKQWTVQ